MTPERYVATALSKNQTENAVRIEKKPTSGAKSTLKLLFPVLLLTGLFLAVPVNADEIRPALLDIKEHNTGLFSHYLESSHARRTSAGYYAKLAGKPGVSGFANCSGCTGCGGRTHHIIRIMWSL